MGKLNPKSKWIATANLSDKLEIAISEAPKGLTVDDLNDCWKEAKVRWDIKESIPEPLYAVLEDDIYTVAQDMNLPDGSITPEIVAKVREAYQDFDFSEHHQFIQEQLEGCGLEEQEEEPAKKK